MGRWGPRLIQAFLLNEGLEIAECLLLVRGKVSQMAMRVSLTDSAGCGYPMYRHNEREAKTSSVSRVTIIYLAV